jgi:mannan endo-1,4-beta-mannosidase
MKIAFFILLFCYTKINAQFVTTNNSHFFINNSKYQFIGCNYWYGGYLYSDTANNGKKRLVNELNFLQKKGITNIRVVISSEGDDSYGYRISPSLQPAQGVYNEALLKGYDYLIMQAAKKNIKIVFVLNNNWEWSGGFGQYLEWNGYGTPPLPKTNQWDWDAYCNYISKFYSCTACMQYYNKWIQHIINRKNSFTQINYANDPTIMAWELANEPRPMKTEAISAYQNWIEKTAAFIKQQDKNHLVTIGVEGSIGTANNLTLFEKVHAIPNIDYATIHIWPKTWQWYNGMDAHAVTDTTLAKTKNYILQNDSVCKKLNIPLVIEEFGLHRDGNSFSPKATVSQRNKYYDFIFNTGNQLNVAGYNFWGFAGVPQNYNMAHFMQKGMAYSADPPQEEQGLYSVFINDKSTWKILHKWSKLFQANK